MSSLIKKLEELGVSSIHLIIINFDYLEALEKLVLETKDSTILHIEITIMNKIKINRDFVSLINSNLRIIKIFAEEIEKQKIKINPEYCKVLKINSFNYNKEFKGKKSFNVNLPLFLESIKKNSYFNKKLFIKKDGEISSAI